MIYRLQLLWLVLVSVIARELDQGILQQVVITEAAVIESMKLFPMTDRVSGVPPVADLLSDICTSVSCAIYIQQRTVSIGTDWV